MCDASGPSVPAAFEHVVQALEQLSSVRQIRERIVLGKVPQLQRAFLDAMFEVRLVCLDRALGVSQLAGHVIERVGEFVELAGAAAHHASRQVTRGQASGPGGQPADGPGDRPRGRGQGEQRQQDRLEGRGPDRLLGLCDGPLGARRCCGECAPRRRLDVVTDVDRECIAFRRESRLPCFDVCAESQSLPPQLDCPVEVLGLHGEPVTARGDCEFCAVVFDRLAQA